MTAPAGHRPAQPVGTVRLAISGTNNGYPWTNVVYLKFTDDGTQTAADLKTIIDAVMASWNTNIRPDHCTSVITTDAKAVWVTSVGNALEYESSVSYTGGQSSPVPDNACCAVINWAINRYYRGGHPRTYHPSLPTGQVTSGALIAAGFQSTLAAAYTAFMNAVNALTATHVSIVALGTVSYAVGNAWRSTPVFYPYKSVGVRNTMGTQRRRLGGR
jgi:uncharacterized membrane protein YphA (DoxX/SURF4 family)